MSVRTVTTVALAALLAPGVAAISQVLVVHPENSCGDPYIQFGAYYLVVDTGGVDLVWVYAEANGFPFLQRGGRSTLGYSDPCRETPYPDYLVV